MKTADEIIVFAVKAFATVGFSWSAFRSALILWPHGWHLSSMAVAGAIATLGIVWGLFK